MGFLQLRHWILLVLPMEAVEGDGCVEPAGPVREENGVGVLFVVSFPAIETVLAGGAVVRVERA